MADVQIHERLQLADRIRQARQLVVRDVEELERAQLTQSLGKLRQLVVAQVERGELALRADIIRQRGQRARVQEEPCRLELCRHSSGLRTWDGARAAAAERAAHSSWIRVMHPSVTT